MKSAKPAFVMKHFVPLMCQPPSTRVAFVDISAGFEPAPGSVSPKEPMTSPAAARGSQASRWASVPPSRIESVARNCAVTIDAVEAQASVTDATIWLIATEPTPGPPNSSGRLSPMTPTSARVFRVSSETRSFASAAAACGTRTSLLIETTASTSSCSSAVMSKAIRVLLCNGDRFDGIGRGPDQEDRGILTERPGDSCGVRRLGEVEASRSGQRASVGAAKSALCSPRWGAGSVDFGLVPSTRSGWPR